MIKIIFMINDELRGLMIEYNLSQESVFHFRIFD